MSESAIETTTQSLTPSRNNRTPAIACCLALLLIVSFVSMERAFRKVSLNRALISAIHANYAIRVRLLIVKGADPNAREALYFQQFLDVVHGEKKVTSAPCALVIALYLETYGEPHATVQAANTEVIKSLLDAGANTDIHYRDGDTPLMAAVWLEKHDVFQLLLDKGVDIQAKNTYGATALMTAAGAGDTQVISQLVDKGAAVNAKDNYGCNALRFAILYGQANSVRALIKRGIDVNARDNSGITPLADASLRRLPQIVALLKGAGARE